MKNIHDEVSRCIIQMLLKEPFFAHLLSGIVRNISKEIPTAAVGLRGTNINLFVNENFFLKGAGFSTSPVVGFGAPSDDAEAASLVVGLHRRCFTVDASVCKVDASFPSSVGDD